MIQSKTLVMRGKALDNSNKMTAENNAYILNEEILNNGSIGAGNMLCMPNGNYSGTGIVSAKVILATEHAINQIKSSGSYNKSAHFIIVPEHSAPWGVKECDTAYSDFIHQHDAL